MKLIHSLLLLACAAPASCLSASAQPAAPQPTRSATRRPPLDYVVAARLPDKAQVQEPSQVSLSGYLGTRVQNNERARLLEVDEDDLLDAFERREVPHQDWQGEHVGKFLHAATLAWQYSKDAALKAKLDRVVARLLKAQEADGYLGTYPSARRWTSWDVWVHKYDLLGLLTYYRYTGEPQVLAAATRVGDLLCATFPAKKSIIQAGEHMGMAATSVLEPMVLLYRTTGEAKYLDFARYVLRAWDEPGGPRLIHTLLTQKDVHLTANGKAYEMMSNLVGLCELARATGDRSLLMPVENAWRDIVAHQLYITGTTSHREHFAQPFDLPNDPGSDIGETCVTVTWIQLNTQMLRLTGESRFANELERSYYNHLAASQQPDGAKWCYYTPLEGQKPYTNSTNCCLSSGPRGMALLPQIAYLKYLHNGSQGLAVNLFETSKAKLSLGDQSVTIEQQSGFPRVGSSLLTLRMARPATFGLKVRTPSWAAPLMLRVGKSRSISGAREGWTVMAPRLWKDGDQVRISFNLSARIVAGEHSNAGRAATLWGPLVLAYDENLNAGGPSFRSVALDAGQAVPALQVLARSVAPGAPLVFEAKLRTASSQATKKALLIPFAQAGSSGGRFAVWLRTPENLEQSASLLASGQPIFSRRGNLMGDISDGDTSTYAVTYDGARAAQDWFGITLSEPQTIGHVVFAHGHCFHDGGWFDARQGKPQIQAQREKGGAWQTLGTLGDYPATTSTDRAGLKDGQEFTLRLSEPQRIIALRVIGQPASGDQSNQAFSSCAELQAFAH